VRSQRALLGVVNARFVVHSDDRFLEGRDHLGAVLGYGKAVTTTTMLMSGASSRRGSSLSWCAVI
jgi:hypothetical protein